MMEWLCSSGLRVDLSKREVVRLKAVVDDLRGE
jgi:hypothetical protein